MKMFSEIHVNSVNIPSSWRQKTTTQQIGCQTDNMTGNEMSVQHPETKTCDTQTSQQQQQNLINEKTRDPIKLLKFIQTATQITIKEIEKTSNNSLLNIITKLQTDREETAVMINKLSPDYSQLIERNEYKYCISCIDWNCNASLVGISYAVKHHTDWCTHESFILLCSVFKGTNKDSQPNTILELENCINVFKCHPTVPSVYAAGTLNGDIAIWNTRNKEGEMLLATISAHQSAVTGLHWIKPTKKSELGIIITCGLDGKIFSLKLQENNKSIIIQKVFTILANDLPRSFNIKGNKTDAEVGITCMSFNYDDPSIFIVGCHAGAVFQCTLNASKHSLNESTISKEQNVSPIVMSYAPHRGHVNALQFSPFSRNIFFSCSIDGELRIYTVLQTTPIMVIHNEHSLIDAQWSPQRANITVISEDGNVHIYSMTTHKVSKPWFTLSCGDGIKPKLLKYNPIEPNEQIAISVSSGETQLWNLSSCTPFIDGEEINNILKEVTESES